MHKQAQEIVEVFRAGGVVIFPTDTVWGIGAFVESDVGVRKLYSLKQRDLSKPTALLVGSLSQALEYGVFSESQVEAVARYWPGGLTAVVASKKPLFPWLLNENGGVGIRWPKSSLLEDVTQMLGGGVVTASANVSGGHTPVSFMEIDEDLLTHADYVVNEQRPLSGISSTVVDLMSSEPRILRQGAVVYEEDQ